jgi:hypothetical protein
MDRVFNLIEVLAYCLSALTFGVKQDLTFAEGVKNAAY